MDGQRVAKKEGGGKLPWVITGAVVGLLAAAYIGTCAWASEKDASLPNVSVAGIDVSNMVVEQARSTVQSAVTERGKDITLTLSYEDLEERRSGADVAVDVA